MNSFTVYSTILMNIFFKKAEESSPLVIYYQVMFQIVEVLRFRTNSFVIGQFMWGFHVLLKVIEFFMIHIPGIPWFEFRLELKGNKYLLGEFLEFKGKQEDVLTLRAIKRSKINRIVVQKTSMRGFGKI